MTTLSRVYKAFFLVIVLALGACAPPPPPQVVKQADPSPLVGAKSFVVAPVTFEGFSYQGQPESAWLKTRSPKQVDSWENDKKEMTSKVLKRFDVDKTDEQSFVEGNKAGEGQFLVAINFDKYDGQMRWTAEIRDASGGVVDVVRDPNWITADFNTWAAENTGAMTAALLVSHYLHSRAFPEQK